MPTIPETADTTSDALAAAQAKRRTIAAQLLRKSREDLDAATRGRIRTAHLARAEGLTNEAIGQALGITETAARTLLKRNPLEDITNADR
jgi:hypothetical protein